MRLAPCDRTGGGLVSVSILGILVLLAVVAVGIAIVVGLVMFFTNRRKEGEL
jgi:nitrate reductase gamma subunit